MGRFLSIVAFGIFCTAPLYAHHVKQSNASSLPLSTTSEKARALYDLGMQDYENLYLERCNEDWREAVKADPNLAVAWAWIAFNGADPNEVNAAREEAKRLAPKGSAGEQLMVSWIAKVQEGDLIGGISAMNDLLEMYPHDKHLLYLAGNWMLLQNNDEQTERLMQKALAVDKNFPAAWNDLAYVEARNREFAKAFTAMERYVALLPGEPNPQDSYGELLRMAGDFEGSLKHYRAALKIDPEFVTSQLGLGDTFALMGNQEQARAEYDKSIQGAHNESDRLTYQMQKATTWVRDGKFAEADKIFLEVAATANSKSQDLREVQAYRNLAEYQTDDGQAAKYLAAAQKALDHSATIAKTDGEEELARILRVQVSRASNSSDFKTAAEALKKLQDVAAGTRDQTVQSEYNGAAGILCWKQQNIEAAIAHLEEDRDDPESMQILVQAYYQSGQSEKLHEMETRLRGTNVPTMEQALVVPAARLRKSQI